MTFKLHVDHLIGTIVDSKIDVKSRVEMFDFFC